jgi:hypothetical protein
MRGRVITVLIIFVVSVNGAARADFKYSEQSKITGGALMQMTQTLGKFSKNMRQANEPQTSTTMVKGNRMREEHADGTVQVIDLDGRRFIYIYPANKTYSVVTFDEFKASMQQAQERARQARQQQTAKDPDAANAAQNVKITPKFDAQVTGATRNILGLPSNEMKMKMEMQFQGTDPKTQQQQSGSYIVNSDSWMAPSVPGYDEVQLFHLKMAKELNWLPGAMGGAMGMNTANPQMGSAMEEFRKNADKVKGLPMLQTISMTFGGNGTAPQTQNPQANSQNNSQTQNPPTQQQQSQNTSVPTSTSGAIKQGLGGMFGGFKKKKQQDDQQQQQSAQNNPAPAGQPGSLMDITSEVTAFSSAPLDSSLFEVPSGFTQVQKNPDEIYGAKQHQ